MKVSQIVDLIQAKVLTPDLSLDRAVTSGYVCDLLSWVMARGRSGMAWVTVQTHLNVIAVASLHEMSCVILPDGIQMEAASIKKAVQEGIAVLTSPMTAYEICARLADAGLQAPPA